MTDKGKAQVFEYLDTEMKIRQDLIDIDVDNIEKAVDKNSYVGQVLEFQETYQDMHDVGFNEQILMKRLNLMFEELCEIAVAGGTSVLIHFDRLLNHKIINNADIIKDKPLEFDKVEVLDGLADLQYVLSGSVIKLGLTDVFDEAFRAVHESNMDKMYSSYTDVKRRASEFERNKDHLTSGLAHKIEIIPVSGEIGVIGAECRYILKVDGKIIKPRDHKKVNLQKFIKND